MSWDSWDTAGDTWDSWDPPPKGGSGGGGGGKAGNFLSPKAAFPPPPQGSFGKSPGGFDKGPGDFGKGSNDCGKGGAGFDIGGSGGFDGGKGTFDGGKNGKGGFSGGKKGNDSSDAGKGGFDGGKGGFDNFATGPGDFGKASGDLGKSFGKSFGGKPGGKGPPIGAKGDAGGKGLHQPGGGSFPPAPPPPTLAGGKGAGFVQPGKMGGDGGKGAPPPPLGPGPRGPGRGQFQPAPRIAAPRLPGWSPGKGDAVGTSSAGLRGSTAPMLTKSLAPVPPPGLATGPSLGAAQLAASSLGNALAAVAGAAARGAFRPPPPPMGAPVALRGLAPLHQQHLAPTAMFLAQQFSRPPPPGGPFMGQQLTRLPPAFGGLLPQAGGHGGFRPPPPPGGLAPELAALVSAAEADDGPLDGKVGILPPEKKPRIYLLVTRLAPELEDAHMQQILEQCGDIQAWRRGRDADGAPLSFGFAQFGDPEAAWKASACLTKLVLCGQEVKVLVEEGAEALIQKWRSSQQAALKVSSEEELAWELERKSVSCRAQIDAKVEEIYGSSANGQAAAGGGGGGGGAFTAQRRQELREREKARVERTLKRKAWRESEYAKERERVEVAEKKLRRAERDKDDADRVKEGSEANAKEESEHKLVKLEDGGPQRAALATAGRLADDRQLCEMVDRVQAEPRDEIFKIDLDVAFLRSERVFEKKLRPWLERKIELFMGGPQSDLVEYIMRRVNGASMPEALISDLTRFLDDSAESLIERLWRMLAFELLRGGLALQQPLHKEL